MYVSAQGPALADADLKELSTYTLTMDTFNKMVRVQTAVGEALKADPKFAEQARLKTELETLRKKDETTEADDKRIEAIETRLEALETEMSSKFSFNDAKDLSDMARRAEAFPPLAVALRKEGLTGRDYAKFMSAVLQAGFAAGMQKAGLLKETPAGVNPANIKFMLDHEAEFKKLGGGGGGQMQ
jgi:hypothetical protein